MPKPIEANQHRQYISLMAPDNKKRDHQFITIYPRAGQYGKKYNHDFPPHIDGYQYLS